MTDFKIEKIAPLCADFGVTLDSEKINLLNLYGNLLLLWNEKINLTAITEPEEVLYKHFYDCILFLKHIMVPQNASLIDVGTGAGFPGTVLKIVRPDINVHMRAEDAGKSKLYREKYDVACARAVANLPVLMEYCVPLVKKGGLFAAMKGPYAKEEAENSLNAARLLGTEKPIIICETLTGNEQRAFVISKKISQTPTKYPRKPADISKQPL